MANQSLVAAITELIPEITLEVDYIYQNNAIHQNLVNYMDVSNDEGVIVEFPVFDEVSGSASPAEGAAPTAQTLNVSMNTGTLAKRGVYVQLSGLSLKGAGSKIIPQIGTAMGMAKAKQDDVQAFGIISGTTDWGTTAGATNAALSITASLAGLLAIQSNEVSEPITCVVNANGYADIRTGLTPVANDDGIAVGIASEVAKEGLASRAFGMNWYVTERISTATVGATTNVYNGLIFVKSAIGRAHAWSPGASGLSVDYDQTLDVYDMNINYYDTSIVVRNEGVVGLYWK